MVTLIEVMLKSSGSSLIEGNSWLSRDRGGVQELRELAS